MFDRWLSAVRQGEGRNVAGAFVTLLVTLLAHELLETARDALFLASIPARQLPWVYLGIASLSLLVVRVSGVSVRRSRPVLGGTLAVAAVVTGLFTILLEHDAAWVLYALYMWSGVLVTLIVLRFWTYLGDLFTVTQAKRLYGLVGLGSVLGAILGSLLAVAIATSLETTMLVPIAAGLLLLASLVPTFIMTDPEETRASIDENTGRTLAEDLRILKQHAHAHRLGSTVLVAAIALTLADYVFKALVVMHVAPEDLGAFFAVTSAVLNLASLLSQLVFVGWIIRRLGVTRSLILLPVFVLFGAVGILAGGALVAALAMKGADGALRHSLHRTAVEMVYLPLPAESRKRIKELIDVLGQRGGQAVAAVVILIFAGASWNLEFFAGAVVVGCVTWVVLGVLLQSTYLELFRDTLKQTTTETRIAYPDLDLESLESLVSALNSPRDGEVVAAMELLAEKKRVQLIPILILYHPAPLVVIRALELFAGHGRKDFVPIADRLLDHEWATVRSTALAARTAASADEALLRAKFESTCPTVRATAVVGLMANDFFDEDETDAAMDGIFDDGMVETKLALAHAIELLPSSKFVDVLNHLALSDDLRIRRAAIRGMYQAPDPSYMAVLTSMLAKRGLRNEVREVILALGPGVLDELGAQLMDPRTDSRVRLHLPRTIHRFETRKALDLLMGYLEDPDDERIAYKSIRALGRLKADHPKLKIGSGRVETIIDNHIRRAFRLMFWQRALLVGAIEQPERGTDVYEFITTMLEHLQLSTLERVFRLLHLLQVSEDFKPIYRGLTSSSAEVRSSSRELLEHSLPARFVSPVVTLIDDVDIDEKLVRAGVWGSEKLSEEYDVVLADMLDPALCHSEALQALVAYHVGELGLTEFAPRLEAYEERRPRAVFEDLLERAENMLRVPVGEM